MLQSMIIILSSTIVWSVSFRRPQTPDNLDYCVIDFDPDKHTYDQVAEAARLVKDILNAIDVPSYPKTSCSTGMHIYIPLGGKYSYLQSQIFANIIVKHVHVYSTIIHMF